MKKISKKTIKKTFPDLFRKNDGKKYVIKKVDILTNKAIETKIFDDKFKARKYSNELDKHTEDKDYKTYYVLSDVIK